MKNSFAAEYAMEFAIRDAYEMCKQRGDETGMEEARALMRKHLDEIAEKGDAYAFVYRLYREMKECGNEHIDLHDAIHDELKVLGMLKECGIKSFTFSSGWSSAVESAWIFQQNGCQLQGLVELNGTTMDWITGEREKVHGYFFSIQ